MYSCIRGLFNKLVVLLNMFQVYIVQREWGYGGCIFFFLKVCVREKRERIGWDEEVMFIFCYIFINIDVIKSFVNQI